MPDKRILWLGSYTTDEFFTNMPARTAGQASGFASEKSLVTGIDEVINGSAYVMDTIGADTYPAYPEYPKVFVERNVFARNKKSRDVNVGFLNIRYVNRYTRYRSLMKEVERWWKRNRTAKDVTIYTYGIELDKMRAAAWLKKRLDGARILTIVPDIPKFVNAKDGKLHNLLKDLSEQCSRKLLPSVDRFILYSKHMAEYYGLAPDRWMVMEGSISKDDILCLNECRKEKRESFVVMYSGAISAARGIPQLLDAFSRFGEKNIELWLTGTGDYKAKMLERAEADKRIKYWGYLDSRKEVLNLEKQADLLMHIRIPDAPYAPFCFPSKIFEYLATGNMVATVKMKGIPEGYYKYMLTISDLTEKGIHEAIREAMSAEHGKRERFGSSASEFVITEKNSVVQAKRILEFAGVHP